MKLLITGGAGFIGSEVVRQAVARGFSVTVIDNLSYAGDIERLRNVIERIKFYRADITDKAALDEIFRKENPDNIIHLAAESHVDRSILEPERFLETNVMGTFNLLELSRELKIKRFINVSTDEVYGELGEQGYFTEESPLKPNSPYSASKASQDMLGRAYWRTYGLPVITVRPSNNYGPWQYPEKLIPVIIVKALYNEKIPLYGDGRNVREWLYVEDCAQAILMILDKGIPGEIYNIGSNEEKKNIEVVKEILKILNRSEDLIEFVKDRPGHDYRYSMSVEKIKKETGWSPKTGFKDGIEKTVRWYMDNIKWLEEKVRSLKDYWERIYKKD
ncbi:MAG: dTDP-glucose 4,6-dehydratase [Thermodesulfovibrionales bacterium]|nr:dTDP-glucose 4,6-dehydratase [Thermodesulfovibrionales bacterium]